MSNSIHTINLADKINEAILKINDNFQNVLQNAGLSEAEVQALIDAAIADIVDDAGFTEQEIRDFLASQTLDLGGNKVLFGNMYPTVGDLPSASTYHGMFAHVHATGAAYFAHGGQWIELANKSDIGTGSSDVESLDDLDDVQLSSPVLVGHVLKWDGTSWTNLEDASGGGGGPTDPGENGTSFYQATIYQRSPTQPATPSGGTFDFPSVTLTPPSGWEGTIPAGDDDLWACNFLFRDYLSQQGTITATDWSEPYKMGGIVDANNGDSYAQVSIFKRSTTTLTAPSGGSFDFGSQVLTPPTDWSIVPPLPQDENGNPTGDLYVSSGIATNAGLSDPTGEDTDISWTNPVKTSTGLDGQDGKSIFEKAVYRKVPKPAGWKVGDDIPTPSKPEGGFFDFGNEVFGDDPLDDANGVTGVWFEGIPEGAGDVWSSTYAFSVIGDTGTDYAVADGWSEPTLGIIESVSTYSKSLYTRSATLPNPIADNNSVTYSFTDDRFVKIGDTDVVSGVTDGTWYEEPPELDLDNPLNLYEVRTTASLIGYLGTDNTLTFSAPKLVMNYAVDAEDGFSFVQLSVYKWSNTSLENNAGKPSGGSFDFSDKTFTQPSGWSKTVPENPNENDANMKLYVSSGIASTQPNAGDTTNSIVVDDVIVWSTPDVTTAGGSGRDGRSTFRAVIVQRTTETPPTLTSPTGGFVNFGADDATRSQAEAAAANVTSSGTLTIGGNSLVPPDGWYDTVAEIPTDEAPDGKIWAVEYQFATDGDTGVETGGTWSAPYEDHNNGEDGYSTFSASVYKRSADKPPATGGDWGPVGATYNFSTDAVENLSGGWSEDPQESNANLDPLWLCRATATTQGLTGTDATLTWSEPVKVSTDGQPGEVDPDTIPQQENGYVYYQVAIGTEDGPDTPTATSFNFIGTGTVGTDGTFTGLTTNWSISPPQDTNLTGSLWAARFFAVEDNAGDRTASTQSGNLLFSPPFKSYSFDGLVTFTNTQGALSRDDGGATRIDGGFITTQTIEVGSIKTDELEAEVGRIAGELTIGGDATGIDTTDAEGYTSSGERMVLTGENIRIYDANSTSETTGLRVKLGKLT